MLLRAARKRFGGNVRKVMNGTHRLGIGQEGLVVLNVGMIEVNLVIIRAYENQKTHILTRTHFSVFV